jgi:hypothetical protein
MIDNKSTTTAKENKENKYPPIILRRNRKRELRNFLEKFADFIGLLPYGTSNLLEQARGYLQAASILMLMIFTFDFLAWGVLFNLIFHQGKFEISNLAFIAAFLAFLLATSILIFEITIFTADFSKLKENMKQLGFWKAVKVNGFVSSSLGIRIVIVLISALITAQPLHILVFDGPISKRAKEEQVIQKASLIVKDSLEKVSTKTEVLTAIAWLITKPKSEDATTQDPIINQKISEITEDSESAFLEKFKEITNRDGISAIDCKDPSCLSIKDQIDAINQKIKDKLADIEDKKKQISQKTFEQEEAQKNLSEANLKIQRENSENMRLNKKKDDAASKEDIDRINQLINQIKNNIKTYRNQIKTEEQKIEKLKIEIIQHENHITDIKSENKEEFDKIDKLNIDLGIAFTKWLDIEKSKIGGSDLAVRAENAKVITDIYRKFISTIWSKKMKMNDRYPDVDEAERRQEIKTSISDRVKDKNRQESINEMIVSDFLTFTFEPLDFFERLRVWDDLMDGNTSKRPDLDQKEEEYFNRDYRISEKDTKRLKSEGLSYRLYHIAVTFIGMFIPLMVLIFKVFLPESLAKYYSNDYQTYCGHPEAIFFSNYIYEDEISEATEPKTHQNQDLSKLDQTHPKEDI